MPGNIWHINLSKDTQKSLLKVPDKNKLQIKNAIEEMKTGPFVGDVKKLKGSKNVYRKRVGYYRLIFTIIFDILYIEIIDVIQRKDAYK